MASATRHRLSPHFVVEEFDSHDGQRVAQSHHEDLERLCDWWLEPLRARFGRVTVHSGFRTKAYNARIGGASHSVHLLTTPMPGAHGKRSHGIAAAADVSCAAGSSVLWQQWAGAHRLERVELGPAGRGGVGSYRNFVHLDTAAARDWRG
jgi:uncharacterized protein YcbK (DUF882 family)